MPSDLSVLAISPAHDFARLARQEFSYDVQQLKLAEIDRDLVRRIIESGFNDRLSLDFFKGKDETSFYLIGDRGIAVVTDDYLDVIAVDEKYQRNGVGPCLLGRVIEETNGRFYLRSQPQRTANRTYTRFAEPVPFVSQEGIFYNGYFVGHGQNEIAPKLEFMASKPSNFVG